MSDHSSSGPLLGPPPEALERLLDQGSPFVSPSRALDGLSAEVACQQVAGAPHSIAEIVAHLHFWQRYTRALAHGETPSVPAHAAEGWPRVRPDDWEPVRHAFLDGLAEFRRLVYKVDLSLLVRPGETLGYELTLHALHNAVHLGQVIQLRQMLGAWPPPGGGDTW